MISKNNIFESEIRKNIFNFIDNNPALNLRAISKRMKIPLSTLMYHIYVLEKNGVIKSKTVGKSKLLYVSMKIGVKEKEILKFIRKKIPFQIFLYLSFSSAISQIETAKELNITPPLVSYYLKKMEKMDLIEEVHPVNGSFTFKAYKTDNNYTMTRNPVKSERLYRMKNKELSIAIWDVIDKYKDSFSGSKYVDQVHDYYEEVETKPKLIKFKLDHYIENFTDFINDIFKPPIAY